MGRGIVYIQRCWSNGYVNSKMLEEKLAALNEKLKM